MVGAQAQFVGGAYHAERLYAAHLRFLDLELVALLVAQDASYGRDGNRLPGGYVGSAADDLHGLRAAQVDGGDVEVVTVGVGNAGEDLADDDATEPSGHGLDLLHGVTFQAQRGERGGELPRLLPYLDKPAEPVVGYIHFCFDSEFCGAHTASICKDTNFFRHGGQKL